MPSGVHGVWMGMRKRTCSIEPPRSGKWPCRGGKFPNLPIPNGKLGNLPPRYERRSSMIPSRRDFLNASGVVALGLSVPTFLSRTALAAPALGKKGSKDTILVVVELTGGND